jgi:hypothetical protein
MARAGHSGTVVGSAVVIREKYYWPDLQLNIWTIVMLATSGLILGVNAQFMQIQSAMGLGTPWYVAHPLSPCLHTNIQQQDHALRRHSRRPRHLIHHHRNRLHRATPPPARNHDAALLHPTRALHRRHHRDRDPTFRGPEYQQPVQYVRVQQRVRGREYEYTGVVAAEEYMSELASRVCVLDYWDGVFGVDDGHGESG